MKSREQYKRFYIIFASFCMWGAMLILWQQVWLRLFATEITDPFYSRGNWLVVAVYGILSFGFSKIFGAYRFGYYRLRDIIFSGIGSVFTTNAVIYLQTNLLAAGFHGLETGERMLLILKIFAWMTLADIIIVFVWSALFSAVYRRLFPPHKMLVVYGGHDNAKTLVMNMVSRGEKYEIHEVIDISEGIDAILERIGHYSAVIICDVKTASRNILLKHCYKNSVRVYLTPKLSDMIIRGADGIHLFDTPLLLCKNQSLSFEQRLIKRSLDLILTLLILIIFSPVFLLTALIVRLSVKGPVFYKQKMLTIGKKEFTLRKFRTMKPDPENPGKLRYTTAGRVLRFLKLDEMPQLFSIISGRLSIVGPRPAAPAALEELEESMPEYMFRFKVKAGVTGQSQIIGSYDMAEYDKLKLDLMYIENYSLLLDIQIIFTAIRNLFLRGRSVPPKLEGARLEISLNEDKLEK